MDELRLALRRLMKRPSATLVSVVTLAAAFSGGLLLSFGKNLTVMARAVRRAHDGAGPAALRRPGWSSKGEDLGANDRDDYQSDKGFPVLTPM
jgi:hypothetical protein